MSSRRVPATIFKVIKGIEPVPTRSLFLLTQSSGLLVDEGSRLGVRSEAVISRFPAAPIDWDSAIYVEWFNDDIDGLAVGSYGDFGKRILDAVSRLGAGSYSKLSVAIYLSNNTSKLAVRSIGDLYGDFGRRNWVKWSNIGSLNFTIGKDNVAGEMPLDWKGWVYAVKKLKNKAVAYGENGVSYLLPVDKYYNLLTIHRLGLKGKNAVAGDQSAHYFIDNAGQLWELSETLELLDYSEYLAGLTNPVLSWDAKNFLLYICDGTFGYVYSPKSRSLGKGPINVTGISSQGGTLYVAAPATIAIPTFEKWTDTYDMGTRRGKGIVSLEFGIDLVQTLKASIKYRLNKASAFSQTGWYTVDSRGRVFIQAYGQEFSFGAKVDVYEQFKVDYLKVNGAIYGN